MHRAPLIVSALLLACTAPREARPPAPTPTEPTVPSVSASTSAAPVAAPSASTVAAPPPPAASSAAPVVAVPPHPCDAITLGPCKVNYSARRTCLVADGYFSVDASAATPKQREKFYACIQKVLTLPAGPKECTDAGTKCADAVSAQWFDKGVAASALPELCAVPPNCASVLGTSCVSAKKLIDDCYYAARGTKKP